MIYEGEQAEKQILGYCPAADCDGKFHLSGSSHPHLSEETDYPYGSPRAALSFKELILLRRQRQAQGINDSSWPHL